MTAALTTEQTCPYPGLRPFRRDEAYLFFGRDEQRNQLLRKLKDCNFVAVVGSSGCGKSSLVLAGLITDLKLGLLGPGRVTWRVALMRPGDRPMDNLSDALLADEALGTILPGPLLREGLRRGPLSLVELLSGSRPDGAPVIAPGENLLLVIDQFEEIFRFRKAAEPAKDRRDVPGGDQTVAEGRARAPQRERIRAEADAFVALILESVRRSGPARRFPRPGAGWDGPPGASAPTATNGRCASEPSADGDLGPALYVILTMRTGFLGECALFQGLPELLSDSQFLTPRLSRPQQREAIEGPAKVEGGGVELALVNRLLNDMGAAPDQLPLVQHALMRLWLQAEKEVPRDADGDATAPIVLKLSDYEAMTGMAGALDRDATNAYHVLGPESRRIAEVMFRLLSERGAGHLDTRRLARVGEVGGVAAVSEPAVLTVAQAFRTADLNLLSLSDDVLDISHESVIRNWSLLSRWVEEEANAAEIYRQLRIEAQRFAADQRHQLQGDRLGPRMLEIALQWRGDATAAEGWRSSAAWAERYGLADDYAQVLDYIRLSEEEARRQRVRAWRRRRLLQAIPITLVAALLVFLGVVAVLRIKSAESRAKTADSAEKLVVARSQAIRALSRKLDDAANVDPFSALNIARSMQANPSDLPGAGDDDEVKAFLDRREQQLQRQNDLLASRTLAFGALTAPAEGYPQRAVLLGVEAVNESQRVGGLSAEIAQDALRQALHQLGGRPLIGREDRGQAIAHRRAVTGMAAEPHGRWVATSSADGTVMVWNLLKPGQVVRLPHDAPVSRLCVSPDGRWLATFSSGRPARLWDLEGGPSFAGVAPRSHTLEGDSSPALYPTFTRDGRWLLLVDSDGGAILWDLQSPGPGPTRRRHNLRPKGPWITHDWAVSHDSRWLSLVKADGEILLWELTAQGPLEMTIPDQRKIAAMVSSVTFSEDNRRLAVALTTGRLLLVNDLDQPGRSVRPFVLDIDDSGKPALGARLGGKVQRRVVATDYDGRWLIVERQPAHALGGLASSHVAWDVGAKDQVAVSYPLTRFPAWMGDSTIDVFADKDKYLVARGQNSEIWIWNLGEPAASAPTVFSGQIGPITSVVFDAVRKRIFTVGSDNAVWAWKLGNDGPTAAAESRSPIVLRGHDGPVTAMVLPENTLAPVLVTGSADSEVRLWDLTDFPSRLTSEPQTLRGRPGWSTVVVTPGRDWLAWAPNSAPPRLRDLRNSDWTAPTLELRGPVGPINSFVTSPDGRWLLANNAPDSSVPEASTTAWVWDLHSPDPPGRPLILRGLEGNVATLRASNDGRWLALTTSGEGMPGSLPTAGYLRDLHDARPGASPIRYHDNVSALEFSPDSRWLVAADADGIRPRRLSADGPVPARHRPLHDSTIGFPPQISRVGGWLGVASRRGDIHVWHLGSENALPGNPPVIHGTGSLIREFQFDPAGRRVFLRDVLGGIRISRLGEKPDGVHRPFELKPVQARGAAISSDGRWFAWLATDPARDHMIRLVDLSSDGDSTRDLPLHIRSAESKAASQDQPAVGLAFSRDGRWLVAVGGASGKIWDLTRPEADPSSFSGQGNSIATVDIAHDRFLTIVGLDNAVRIWDLDRPDRQRYPTILRHDESTTATHIVAPDGQWAITVVSQTDNVARTWRLTAQQLKSIAEETVGRNLTPAESQQYLYWRQNNRSTFPGLPDPADEPFTSTGAIAPTLGAPPGPRHAR